MARNSLRYYVYRQMLMGSVGDKTFTIEAVSGGARGSINPSRPQGDFSSFDPTRGSTFNKKKDARVRGGPIPPGLWRIEVPSVRKGFGPPVSKLTPIGDERDKYPMREYENVPFLIHGPGELGSDGCIVIEPKARAELLNQVEKVGGAILTVIYDWDEDLGRRMAAVANTA